MGTMHEIGYYEGEVNSTTPCSPLSMYGIAKNALRQAIMTYCEDKDVSLKWLRAYYITGDDKNNKSIFARILQMAQEGQKTFPFTSGVNKYDFIDVAKLAQYIATVFESPIDRKQKVSVDKFLRHRMSGTQYLSARGEYCYYSKLCADLQSFYNEVEEIENITVKGEFVITVNNSLKENNEDDDKISLNYEKIIKELISENVSSKDILKMMKALGLKRNDAYNLINKLQD